MEFSKMNSSTRWFRLLLCTLIVLNSCFDLASAAYPPDYYGGSDVSGQTEECSLSYMCEGLCGDGENSLCSGDAESLNCFCHQPINLAGANGYTCGDTVSVAAGATEYDEGESAVLKTCVRSVSQGFRSRQEVTLCTAGGDTKCFSNDFLDEIPVETTFLGKDVIYNCKKFDSDPCEAVCGGESLVACVQRAYAQCLCSKPPSDADGYTCTKTDTVTSSTVPRGGENAPDTCQDQATQFVSLQDADVYTCTHPEFSNMCVFTPVLPDAPETTTPAPISIDVSGSVKCKNCESDGTLLSLLVCTILCTIETVVITVKSLITGVLQVAKALLGYIPELLLEVVNAIGDL